MVTKQERYEQTPKGKEARRKAVTAYRTKGTRWEVLLDPKMSEQLERAMPDGVSRSAFIKKIFQEYLDKVGMPDTY